MVARWGRINAKLGQQLKPREWFLVPYGVIEEAIDRIKDGTITRYAYDPLKAALVEAAV